MAARVTLDLEREGSSFAADVGGNMETLRAAAVANVARLGAANAGVRGDWMRERIAGVAWAGEALVFERESRGR